MKDKHMRIARDEDLLRTINQRVKQQLLIDNHKFLKKLWLKFLVYASLTISAYCLLFYVSSPIVFIACFVSYGLIALLFAFNFSHDFSHNTVFKNNRWNHIGFTLLYTMVGAHADAWKHRHIHSHHYAPNVEDYDTDLQITKLIRVIPGSEYRWYHRYQHWYAPLAYTTYSLFWVFVKDFIVFFSDDEALKGQNKNYHLVFWLQKFIYLTYILVLPLMWSGQTWHVVLLGFLLMHLVQSVFLLFTFFMTHHVENTVYPTTNDKGQINTSWLMNQIRSSNDMHPFSETANFILGGFNNHIAHHLFPHIHHIYYPRLNAILYEVLQQQGIQPNQTTYVGGVISHLRLLKKMGADQ